MKSQKKILFYLLISILTGCSQNKKISNEGQILHKHRMYDTENHEIIIKYEEKDLKIWFSDSCVIIEVFNLNIKTDQSGKEIWNHSINKYTYLDLKTMIFYDYKNFSDTSTLQKRYTLPESAFVGWQFYGRRGLISFSDNLIPRADTMIKNINYKRLGGVNTFYSSDKKKKQITHYTYYMRCDKKNTIFHVDRLFDEKIKDCPASRFDYSVDGENQYINSTQYEFVADSLNKFEQKIFKKWAANARRTKLPLKESEE